MISVPGTITIRSIPSRFGNFNKGTLDCSIGTFTVKDSSIEEFEPGVYNGNFVIEKIKPSSYISSGTMVMEIRAFLNAILLSDEGEPLSPSEGLPDSLEQDPIEEESQGIPMLGEMTSTTGLALHDQDEDESVASMFGVLWPLGNVVKLDPTINRAVFRQQKDYLKSCGYHFEAGQQHWVK